MGKDLTEVGNNRSAVSFKDFSLTIKCGMTMTEDDNQSLMDDLNCPRCAELKVKNSGTVAEINPFDSQDCYYGDALIYYRPGNQPGAILCCNTTSPVLIITSYKLDKNFIALVNVSRKTAKKKIIAKTIKTLTEHYGVNERNLIALVWRGIFPDPLLLKGINGNSKGEIIDQIRQCGIRKEQTAISGYDSNFPNVNSKAFCFFHKAFRFFHPGAYKTDRIFYAAIP